MLRLATPADAQQMLGIYAPIVHETAATFEYVVPTLDEFRDRIIKGLTVAPWLVDDRDGELISYAYGGLFRSRAAYQWTIETTVEVKDGYRRGGHGKAIYRTLINLLRAQGYCTAVAVIEIRNLPSIEFHKRLGFTHVGTFRRSGYKLAEWQDSSWWQLLLREDRVPAPVLSMDAFTRSPEFAAVINGFS
ncbi:N-acetyltransferase [candidate division KSB1 bacterium]|nr:N-acetyltransferase [candidate division KSB1 bacterium]